jgi:hypothetical protein
MPRSKSRATVVLWVGLIIAERRRARPLGLLIVMRSENRVFFRTMRIDRHFIDVADKRAWGRVGTLEPTHVGGPTWAEFARLSPYWR